MGNLPFLATSRYRYLLWSRRGTAILPYYLSDRHEALLGDSGDLRVSQHNASDDGEGQKAIQGTIGVLEGLLLLVTCSLSSGAL
jgi:hypothetical protein